MTDQLEQLGAQFLAQRHVLTAFIYGLVRHPETAEDILQEVWLRLAEATRKGTVIQDSNAWCRATARNLVLHHWRKQRNQSVIPDSSILDLVEKAFEEQSAAQSAWAARKNALQECLKTLPDRSRELLVQVYENGAQLTAVAQTSGQTYGAMLMLLSRVRKALRECVARRLQEGLSV